MADIHTIQNGGKPTMTYPVEIVLDEGNLTVRLREIREWLSRHAVDPGALNYRMFADPVRLRIDFVALPDATKFAEVFGGLVFGAPADHADRHL